MAQGVTVMRLERLADERDRTNEKLTDLIALAEEEKRDMSEFEKEQAAKYRTTLAELEEEIMLLGTDVERVQQAKDVSALVREDTNGDGNGVVARRYPAAHNDSNGPVVYRTFAEFARDQLIVRFPHIAEAAAGHPAGAVQLRQEAEERLERAVQNTLSTNVGGLIPQPHMAQIMDIIDASRPVANSGRQVPLDRGKLSYPVIATRPTVVKQTAEKTEAGTVGMVVNLATTNADTYLGAGDLSWQAVNWSTPDALQLWFDLAAEAYARQTENAACDALEDGGSSGTVGTLGTATRLGTTGTEDFNAWRSATMNGLSAIYTATGGRQRTNTLYLSSDRFFSLAGLGTASTLQVSAVGNLDLGSMTGTWSGLRVIGSYAFDQGVAILGDSSAFLVGETPGSPVEMRVVEPTIGGWQVGVIGAFAAKVFDPNRFIHLGVHA